MLEYQMYQWPLIEAFDLCGWAMEELDWRARAAAVEAMAASAPGTGWMGWLGESIRCQ